jgi:hypothetical protein
VAMVLIWIPCDKGFAPKLALLGDAVARKEVEPLESP